MRQAHATPREVERLAQRGEAIIWKSVHLPPAGEGDSVSVSDILQRIEAYREAGVEIIVLDTIHKQPGGAKYGGTGLRSDWQLARRVVEDSPLPVLLAGGLGPENVVEALRQVRPFGVDMASGVESSVGRKDGAKVKAVVGAVRRFRG